MADCTIKNSTYVSHDRLHVFLFSSEKLEKDKHLKLVVSHLSTDFTLYFEPYIHIKTKDNIQILLLCFIYLLHIYLFV